MVEEWGGVNQQRRKKEKGHSQIIDSKGFITRFIQEEEEERKRKEKTNVTIVLIDKAFRPILYPSITVPTFNPPAPPTICPETPPDDFLPPRCRKPNQMPSHQFNSAYIRQPHAWVSCRRCHHPTPRHPHPGRHRSDRPPRRRHLHQIRLPCHRRCPQTGGPRR